jgi:anti-sigma-K factor RskA
VNIQEYISSGVIESYVLGQLSAKESAELEALAKKHPEVNAEIRAVEETLLNFSAKTPPAHLKAKILSRLELKEEAKVVSIGNQGSSIMTWVAAASVALLIGSAIYNFVLMNKMKSTEEELAQLATDKEKYRQDFEAQSASYQQMAEDMSIMMSPENKKVMLKGMDAAPEALAAVYWNPNSKDVYINVSSLPAPAEGKQYQLWAIVDGKPVDAGVFDMDSTMLHKMKAIEGAQAFAVTLEQKGGSPVPTMTAMYLMGNV